MSIDYESQFIENFRNKYGNEYLLLDPYINMKQTMHIKHLLCGTVFKRNLACMYGNNVKICPKCYPRNQGGILHLGCNDIHTSAPWMEEYLLDPDDAYRYSPCSDKRIEFVCSICKDVQVQRIKNIYNKGFSCKKCGNKKSFGERFFACLLDTLNIKYIPQFSPEWIGHYRYDFMFSYFSNKYIVEIDGGFHYIDFKGNDSHQLVIERDRYKTEQAVKHGYILIRLNYNYTKDKINCIINAIQDSILSQIFDLSEIDFMQIARDAESSIIKKTADLWNSYEEKGISKIEEDLNITKNCARSYLNTASDLGLIPESRQEIKRLNHIHGNKKHRSNMIRVKCVQTNEVFDNMTIPSLKYHGDVGGYFRYGRRYTGKLPDGTKLTWQKIV